MAAPVSGAALEKDEAPLATEPHTSVPLDTTDSSVAASTLQASGTDSLAVLRCARPGKFASKVIRADGVVESFQAGMWFHHQEVPIGSIFDLYGAVETWSRDPRALVIRGGLKPERADAQEVQRTKNADDAYFDEAPRRWMMVDIDNLPPPEGVELVSPEAVEYLVEQLPPEVRNASFVYQWSSSAGADTAKGRIKVHLWFWLDRPYGADELKRWGLGWNVNYEASTGTAKLIDVAPFRTVQPHYIASPRFENGTDHIPHRMGIVRKEADAAALDIPAEVVLRGGGAVLNYETETDDAGKITDGRERHLVSIRLRVLHEDQPETLEDWCRLIWERFQAECATGETKHSPTVWTFDKIVEKCRQDRKWEEYKRGKLGPPRKPIEGVAAHFQAAPVTAGEGSTQLRALIEDFLQRPVDMAIRITSGTGKTSKCCELIALRWRPGMVCHYFVPTHATAGEALAHFERCNSALRVKVIEGRNENNCRRYSRVGRVVAAGLPVHATCCEQRSSFGDGKDAAEVEEDGSLDDAEFDHAIKEAVEEAQNGASPAPPPSMDDLFRCPFLDECRNDGYEAQFQEGADVYLFAHQHISLKRRPEIPAATFNVVDESFFAGLTDKKECPPGMLRDLPDELGRTIRRALEDGLPLLKALRDRGYTAEQLEEAASDIHREWARTIILVSPGSRLGPIDAHRRISSAYYILRELVKEMRWSRDESNKVHLQRGEDGTETIVAHWMKKHRLDAPTLFLDATADEEILRCIKPGIAFHKIDVERRAAVTQVVDERLSKSRLISDKRAEKNVTTVQGAIDNIAAKHASGLIVTFQAIKEKFTVPEGWEITHFGAIRGVDKWGELEAAIVIGNWLPPVGAMEAQTRALAGDTDEALILPGEYVEAIRGYRLREGALGVSVKTHPDPLAQACLEQFREAESLQAIDRLRLIHNGEKSVYILSSVPLDITVDRTVRLGDLAGGGSHLEKVLERFGGVFPGSAKLLAALAPDLFSGVEGAKWWLRKFKGGNGYKYLLAIPPFENTFRKMDRRGGKAVPFLALPNHPAPRAMLEHHVGELSTYEGPEDLITFSTEPKPNFEEDWEENFWRVFNPPPIIVRKVAP